MFLYFKFKLSVDIFHFLVYPKGAKLRWGSEQNDSIENILPKRVYMDIFFYATNSPDDWGSGPTLKLSCKKWKTFLTG